MAAFSSLFSRSKVPPCNTTVGMQIPKKLLSNDHTQVILLLKMLIKTYRGTAKSAIAPSYTFVPNGLIAATCRKNTIRYIHSSCIFSIQELTKIDTLLKDEGKQIRTATFYLRDKLNVKKPRTFPLIHMQVFKRDE